MKEEMAKARQFCANYSCGKCAGVMIEARSGSMRMWVDSKYAMQECNPNECAYYFNIVIPGIPKGRLWTR